MDINLFMNSSQNLSVILVIMETPETFDSTVRRPRLVPTTTETGTTKRKTPFPNQFFIYSN